MKTALALLAWIFITSALLACCMAWVHQPFL